MSSSIANRAHAPAATPTCTAPVAVAGDVQIFVSRLSDLHMGLYDDTARVIWLDNRLTLGERRCTLAHELVHAEYRDRPLVTESDATRTAREARVDKLVAVRLISLQQVAEVLIALKVDAPTLATRLGNLDSEEHAAIWRHIRALDAEFYRPPIDSLDASEHALLT